MDCLVAAASSGEGRGRPSLAGNRHARSIGRLSGRSFAPKASQPLACFVSNARSARGYSVCGLMLYLCFLSSALPYSVEQIRKHSIATEPVFPSPRLPTTIYDLTGTLSCPAPESGAVPSSPAPLPFFPHYHLDSSALDKQNIKHAFYA